MITTLDVCKRIQNNEQIIFVKYGDGEINCMTGSQGANCDNDPYTAPLGNGLVHSLIFYINHPNAYVGKWHGSEGIEKMNYVLKLLNVGEPKWVDYHLVMNDNKFFGKKDMFTLLQTIQNTTRKKIIFTNEKNIRMKNLFRADSHIVIPPFNWFVNLEHYFNLVLSELTPDSILFTAGGQGSKVLIAELLKRVPTITCIDIGSSFDFLCQKKKSRDWTHTYEEEVEYYKELLPAYW